MASSETRHRVVVDDRGHIILQLGGWAHAYVHPMHIKAAYAVAADLRRWIATGTTDGLDGHDAAELAVDPAEESIRAGTSYAVEIHPSTERSDPIARLAGDIRAARSDRLGTASHVMGWLAEALSHQMSPEDWEAWRQNHGKWERGPAGVEYRQKRHRARGLA